MTYHATVERSGKYWAVHVAEIDRWTQARHLRELEEMTEDLIDVMGFEPSEIVYDIKAPGDAAVELARADELRATATFLQAAASASVRHATLSLRDDTDLPLRDIAQLIGVSHQRVSQILNAEPADAIADIRFEVTPDGRQVLVLLGGAAAEPLLARRKKVDA